MSVLPRLAKYRNLHTLTVGVAAAVCRAETLAGVPCVLKIFRNPSEDQGISPSQPSPYYLRELEILSLCKHPNFVALLDFGHTLDSGEDYLALEWIDGSDFVTATKAVSTHDFFSLIAQVCIALDFLHSRGFVHGDLKPANLFVANNHNRAKLKLIDFSFSTTHSPAATSDLFGSPHYVAPERLRGEPASFASDLYAFGIVLYECIAGARPYEGQSAAEILDRHLHEPLPPLPASSLPSIHPLIYQLLSKDSTKRPPSAAETLRLVNSVYSGQPFPLNDDATWRSKIGSLPTIGRHRVEAQIRPLLTTIAASTSSTTSTIVLLEGSPGNGKSRLLREIGLVAREMGLILHYSPSASEPDLTSFCSGISSHLHYTTRSPFVILCDNVQTADLPTLIHRLTDLVNTSRPFLCVLAINPILAPSTGLSSSLSTLPHPIALHRLHIDPLNIFDVEHFLTAALRLDDVPPRLARVLYDSTGGNCEALVITVSTALNAGLLRTHSHPNDAAATELDGLLPTPLVKSITDHYSLLTVCATEILAAIVVSSHPLTLQDIAAVTGFDSECIMSHCLQLSAVGLIKVTDTPAPHYIAAGTTVAKVVLSIHPAHATLGLNARFAQWYSTACDLPQHNALAAVHFQRASMVDQAIEYSFSAARDALEAVDYESVAAHYRRILQLSSSDSPTQRHASLGLANALHRLGHSGEALDITTRLLTLRDLTDAATADIHILRARLAFQTGDAHLMQRSARSALTVSSTEQLVSQSNEALYYLGVALSTTGHSHEGLRVLCQAAIQARTADNYYLFALALDSISGLHWSNGQYRLALNYQRRSDIWYRRCDSQRANIARTTNLGILLCDAGLYRKGLQMQSEAHDLATKENAGAFIALVLNNKADVYRCLGNLKAAHTTLGTAHATLPKSVDSFIKVAIQSSSAQVAVSVGNYSDAISRLKHLLKVAHSLNSQAAVGTVLRVWPVLLYGTGRFDLARRAAEHGIQFAVDANQEALVLDLSLILALSLLSLGDLTGGSGIIVRAMEKYESRSSFDVRMSALLASIQIDAVLGITPTKLKGRVDSVVDTTLKKKMAWHSSWALRIRGQVQLKANHLDEAAGDFLESMKIARGSADRPNFWKGSYWLGRVFEQRLQYERALSSYRVAALTINELAMDIEDERYREPFLAQPEVREVLARHERLRNEVGRKARHDIAAMSRSEKISRRMLNALSTIGQKLTSTLDLNELLSSLMDLSIENVRAERGMVFLRDEATGELRLACARGMDRVSLDGVESFSRSVIRQVAEGHALLKVDVGSDPALSAFKSLVIHEIKSILCVPMRIHGRTVGVIYLDTRKAAQMFTDKEKTFVESFASQAAIAIENARMFGHMREENCRLMSEVRGDSRFENLIGSSPAMHKLRDAITAVLANDCNVLILGESGTGKELVAKAIHYNGLRQDKKFVAIDCGALPDNLLEAELFGFVRGAFTGADRDRVGLVEAARGGTLFLDEITNTSLALQARLLRVLQEHEVRRLGENTPRQVDVRVLAATNADIHALMKEGKFRSDLFYRLNVVTIEIPPLRERTQDIPLLVGNFLKKHPDSSGTTRRFKPGVVEALCRYSWPGNVRELENILERLVVMTPGCFIGTQDLPEMIRAAAGIASAGTKTNGNGHKTGEQSMIEEALRRFRGDKAKAARFIGWNRQKLYRKIKAYGIPADYGHAV